jgi:uncharacterized protein YdhG (YjbR/CyaY superfamily)
VSEPRRHPSKAKNPIDAYIAAFPAKVRKLLQQMRRTLREEAPDAVERLSYGIPTFDVDGQHLVHFAGFARHVGFYPTARGIAAFAKELAGYKSGKGSVQFPLDEPLPLELVRRVVRFRLDQSRAAAKRQGSHAPPH